MEGYYALDSNSYALESGDLDKNGTQYTPPIPNTPPIPMRVTPTSIAFVFDCNGSLFPQSRTLLVEGESGVTFRVTPPGNVEAGAEGVSSRPMEPPLWFLGVSPITGTVGSTVTINVDPSKRTTIFEQTQVTIASLPPATSMILPIPVSLLCMQNQLFLPFAPR